MTAPAAIRVTGLEPGYVRQRAEALVRNGKERVLVIHAQPIWDGSPELRVADRTVRVRACVSQLAVLAEYDQLPDDEYLVVVTDRPRQDLGDAVLLRAWRRDIELPDLWGSVPALFGASGVARDLRRVGAWAPSALLGHVPTGGWPRSPGPEVPADHAIGNLIAHLLGLSLPETPDADLLFGALTEPRTRSAWLAVDPVLRRHLIDWSAERLGPEVAFALRVSERDSPVAPLAVGVVVGALWSETDGDPDQQQAVGRLIERHLAGRGPIRSEAVAIGRAARAAVSRRLAADPEVANNVLAQAEALLRDLGWAEGAARSALLPAGLTARLRALGSALTEGPVVSERALADVLAHALARPDSRELLTARMAVRLARWLETEETPADTFSSSLRQQVDDGAWVDRAVTQVWNGSDDGELAARYGELLGRVRVRRMERDRRAAVQLATQTSAPEQLDRAVPVEAMLAEVVRPWSSDGGVLLVVLDGMSTAVATEVAEGAAELGLAEWVPNGGRRMSAVAVLPSLTELSRASLFSGALVEGTGAAEKRGLAAAFPGAPLFHKDDLRAEAGAQLPDPVTAAIEDTPGRPVVGVVINTIDDTLHKQDPSSMRWTVDRLAPLGALLFAASAAGRTVILTADHGHVVEHDSQARSVGTRSPRWRPIDSGPAGDGEVRVAGSRVLAAGGEAVLLWREDIHYGARHPGYHGGASLAEVTVPVIVLQRAFTATGEQPAGAAGWQPAPPQAPEWWNEPARDSRHAAAAPQTRPTKRSTPPGDASQDTLFDVVERPVPATVGDLTDVVLASEAYAEQRARAGRRSLDDATVAAILRALLARGNRAHRDTLASAAGIPAAAIEPTLAAIKRLLNVDGYPVVEQDADLVTVKLDEALLSEQFGA